MRNNAFQRVLFFLLTISLLLLLSNCRILRKSKSEFTENQVSEIDSSFVSKDSENKNSEIIEEQNSSYDFSSNKYSELFKLSYQNHFDAQGNIIPLIFRHTINGKTEEFYLSGGSLSNEKKSSLDGVKKNNSNNINTLHRKEITSKKQKVNKTIANSFKQNNKKDKLLNSYGIRFWFQLGIILLIILLLIYRIKFKKTKLESFIQRVFNEKK